MCGRYTSVLAEELLVDQFGIATVSEEARLLPPSWNVAPTQQVLIVVPDRDPDAAGNRLEVARWGLVPPWAKNPRAGARMINARAETIADKPSFRSAFARRRCLVPASGYFEWAVANGVKTPYWIRAEDDAPLAFAGLYEFWRDGAAGEGAPWLATCTIVTTAARDEMRDIHDRQPVMLDPDRASAWLDRGSDQRTLFDVIAAPAPPLTWHAVGSAVGDPRHNHPSTVEPVRA